MAVCYHSNDNNPGPEEDSISGTRSRQFFRNNIRFIGCPIDPLHYYACIISDNESQGQTTGSGLYEHNETVYFYALPHAGNQFVRWNDNNTDNPRTIILTQDTLFVAFFRSTVGIDDINDHGGYVIASRHLQLTIQGAQQQPIHIYDIMGRHIASVPTQHPDNIVFDLPHSGVYLVRIGQEKPVKVLVR